MPSFMDADEFRSLVQHDAAVLTRPSLGYDILVRPEHCREFFAERGAPYSMGGRDQRGDIVVWPATDRHDVMLMIGAKFTVDSSFRRANQTSVDYRIDDAVESYLRCVVYDACFGQPGINQLHRWTPGKWGDAYDSNGNLPYITLNPRSGDLQEAFLDSYDRAVSYLRLLDSP